LFPPFFTFLCESEAMSPLLAIFGLGQMELLIVAAVVLLLFGHRLPSMMRSLGSGITQFKRGMHETVDDSEPSEKKAEE
jgi:sec-independent protein translocase protein TatA